MGVYIEHGEVDLLADDVTTEPWSSELISRQVSKSCLAAKLEQSRHEYVLEEGSPEAVSNVVGCWLLVVGFNLTVPIACPLFCESVIHFYIYFQGHAALHSGTLRLASNLMCIR